MALEDFYYERVASGYQINGLKNKSLKNIEIPEGVSVISKEAFCETDIKSVHFPKSLLKIGNSAFWLCEELESVTFEEDCALTEIEEYGFCSCISLKKITLPESIKSIYSYAFMNCEALKEITIPYSTTLLKAYIFEECFSLEKIIIENKDAVAGFHSLWSGGCDARVIYSEKKPICVDKTANKQQNEAKNETLTYSKLTDFNLEMYKNGWKILGLRDKSKKLTELVIPKNAYAIGKEAFKGITTLTKVVGHERLEEISVSAFEGCTSLKEVIIDTSTAVLNYAFKDCISLKKAHITPLVCDGAYAFSGVESVSLDDNVDIIKPYLFYECKCLKRVTLPKSVTYISSSAFANCTKLSSVTFSNEITYILNNAFEGCTSLTYVELPKKLTYLMDNAFRGCSSIDTLKINDCLTKIKSGTFLGCTSLRVANIPKNTELEENAFEKSCLIVKM